MPPVGGKLKKLFFVPNELKSPKKQHVFLFLFHIWGEVRPKYGQIHIFLLNPSLNIYVFCFGLTLFIHRLHCIDHFS